MSSPAARAGGPYAIDGRPLRLIRIEEATVPALDRVTPRDPAPAQAGGRDHAPNHLPPTAAADWEEADAWRRHAAGPHAEPLAQAAETVSRLACRLKEGASVVAQQQREQAALGAAAEEARRAARGAEAQQAAQAAALAARLAAAEAQLGATHGALQAAQQAQREGAAAAAELGQRLAAGLGERDEALRQLESARWELIHDDGPSSARAEDWLGCVFCVCLHLAEFRRRPPAPAARFLFRRALLDEACARAEALRCERDAAVGEVGAARAEAAAAAARLARAEALEVRHSPSSCQPHLEMLELPHDSIAPAPSITPVVFCCCAGGGAAAAGRGRAGARGGRGGGGRRAGRGARRAAARG
jgi:hypothetical protein